jgi:hypothetical protein
MPQLRYLAGPRRFTTGTQPRLVGLGRKLPPLRYQRSNCKGPTAQPRPANVPKRWGSLVQCATRRLAPISNVGHLVPCRAKCASAQASPISNDDLSEAGARPKEAQRPRARIKARFHLKRIAPHRRADGRRRHRLSHRARPRRGAVPAIHAEGLKARARPQTNIR